MKTYKIRKDIWPKAEKKLKALAKRADKLGCPGAISWAIIDQIDESVYIDGIESYISYNVVTVSGLLPRIEGWHIVALLEVVDGDVFVNHFYHEHSSVSEEEVVKYAMSINENVHYTQKLHCDHCGKHAFRYKAALLWNGEQFKQVGLNCIKDFTGHASPESIITLAENASSVQMLMMDLEEEGSDYSTYPRDATLYSVRTMLEYASLAVRLYGYANRRIAEERKEPTTAERVMNMVFSKYSKEKPLDSDRQYVDELLEWAREYFQLDKDQKNLSAWAWNVGAILKKGGVQLKHLPLLFSIIAMYERTKKQDVLDNKESQWVGIIGRREDFILTKIKTIEAYSRYGTYYVHIFHDPNKNIIVWKSPTNPYLDGETYKVSAKVKEHSYHGDVKQTVIYYIKAKED